MVNKYFGILILCFLATACDGGKVQFTSPTNTKTASPYIENDMDVKTEINATYVRGAALGAPNKIIVNGGSFFISPYSSVQALSFENQVNYGQSVSVKIQAERGSPEKGHAPTPNQEVPVYVISTIQKN